MHTFLFCWTQAGPSGSKIGQKRKQLTPAHGIEIEPLECMILSIDTVDIWYSPSNSNVAVRICLPSAQTLHYESLVVPFSHIYYYTLQYDLYIHSIHKCVVCSVQKKHTIKCAKEYTFQPKIYITNKFNSNTKLEVSLSSLELLIVLTNQYVLLIYVTGEGSHPGEDSHPWGDSHPWEDRPLEVGRQTFLWAVQYRQVVEPAFQCRQLGRTVCRQPAVG